jgi:hypothetical protein
MRIYHLLLVVLALTFVPYFYFVSTPTLDYLFEMQSRHAELAGTFVYWLVSVELWFMALAPVWLTAATAWNMYVDVSLRRIAR